jgi:capsular exopolysaccharide synthesis family protein
VSRIFDALQRSGTELSGTEYPDMVSVAREVFEAPRNREQASAAQSEVMDAVPGEAVATLPEQVLPVELDTREIAGKLLHEFPSLQVNITTASRLVYFTEPESLAAEKFRFLGVRLRQLRHSRPLKKMLVTSAIPSEGKSLVSANLAGVLSRRKEKVLLIEGDLRRPGLAPLFGVGKLAGLSEWLQSGQQTVSNIYYLEGPNFCFLPAGNLQANPLELMQSGRLSHLMSQLPTMFDWIVVDSPPLLPLADTTVWSRLIDGTLLVVREGTTEKKALHRGLDILKKSDLLGIVLNGSSEPEHNAYYQSYSPKPRN